MITSGTYCRIKKPSMCWLDIFEGVLDFSRFKDCTTALITVKEKENWYQLLEANFKIPKGANFMTYPNSEKVGKPSLIYSEIVDCRDKKQK
jgi:hypothetical protein